MRLLKMMCTTLTMKNYSSVLDPNLRNNEKLKMSVSSNRKQEEKEQIYK